jgi:molybdopterin-guanine dinucleotide biosynthesis protein A
MADGMAAVLPASDGPRGLEPLCAAYGTGCLPAIEAAIDRGDRAVISFFGDVDLRVLDAAEVARHGAAEHMFMNVNRPRDRIRAEGILASRGEV